jgi:hypothetical protein
LALLRQPKDFSKLATSPAMFVGLNVLTAVAWLSFFFGLKWLEPAVVPTLYNGIGPLTVLVLGGLGWIEVKGRPSTDAAGMSAECRFCCRSRRRERPVAP